MKIRAKNCKQIILAVDEIRLIPKNITIQNPIKLKEFRPLHLERKKCPHECLDQRILIYLIIKKDLNQS